MPIQSHSLMSPFATQLKPYNVQRSGASKIPLKSQLKQCNKAVNRLQQWVPHSLEEKALKSTFFREKQEQLLNLLYRSELTSRIKIGQKRLAELNYIMKNSSNVTPKVLKTRTQRRLRIKARLLALAIKLKDITKNKYFF